MGNTIWYKWSKIKDSPNDDVYFGSFLALTIKQKKWRLKAE